MSEAKFSEPRLALNRIYTRTGDGGSTHLAGGQQVNKDGRRIEAYGTVDELNAFVGAACVSAEAEPKLATLARTLRRIQHELFNLGSILSTLPEDVHPQQARITDADVAQLERDIDEANADLHIARTVCRRAERAVIFAQREEAIPPEAVRYLNRLSDALFVWSRWANHALGASEVLWKPNEAASGKEGS